MTSGSFSRATQQLRYSVRALAPLVFTLFLLLLCHLPSVPPTLASIMPPLALMAVFFWAVHRPDWFSAPAAFVIGLLVDLLMAAPLGLTAGLYGVSHILLTRQQRFFLGANFLQLWAGYAVTQLFVTLGQALGWWLLLQRTPVVLDWLLLNILGALLFLPIGWLLTRVHRALLVD